MRHCPAALGRRARAGTPTAPRLWPRLRRVDGRAQFRGGQRPGPRRARSLIGRNAARDPGPAGGASRAARGAVRLRRASTATRDEGLHGVVPCDQRRARHVEVTAEVVRLDLDVTDLELAFDAHSLEPSVDQEVTLTNPGNSAVDFVGRGRASASRPRRTIKPYGSADARHVDAGHGVPNAAKLHAHVPAPRPTSGSPSPACWRRPPARSSRRRSTSATRRRRRQGL